MEMEYEKEILEFWQENKIFEKSLSKKAPLKEYIFYDGPPFATGAPHYGHILANIIKDAIPRYKTMQGFKVNRKWGWDCHGLPIENLIEKELNLKNKKDIENFGIDKFNNAAKDNVLRYNKEWKHVVPRIGRWVDMERAYKTMDSSYTESIWWAFKKLFSKGLIYKDHKSMHICPRCETTLSNFEVTQGYKDITDISLTAKFKLKNKPNDYILAWTTTPWTLPANVALAINKNLIYCKIKYQKPNTENNAFYILAKDRLKIIKEKFEIINEFKGKELIGLKYEPIFDYYKKANLKNKENGWKVYEAGFVTTQEGTGIVHIAPAFGADDMLLEKKYNLPFIKNIGVDGKFTKEVKDFAFMLVKPKNEHQKTDIEIIKWLSHNDKLFAKEKIIHSYPHCWRCDTPLLNYASTSWFVNVTKIKKQILANNKKINWVPKYLQAGRFGKWIQESPDWAISRTRYWGAPIPVWQCNTIKSQNSKLKQKKACGKIEVIGSLDELNKKANLSNNTFYFVRHGESENNVLRVVSDDKNKNPITAKGIIQIEKTAKKLKKENIDIIISSPVLRTKQSAEIISKITRAKLEYDNELREIEFGEYNNKKSALYEKYWSKDKKTNKHINLNLFYGRSPKKGENFQDLKNRMFNAIKNIDNKYKNKHIVIVTHKGNIWVAKGALKGFSNEIISETRLSISNGSIDKVKYSVFPINNDLELDLHRPYIDKIEFPCDCGGNMKRIPEVFDCWFESGSMPFASIHYPFENKNFFDKNFPADFVAEGIDQTRGWFYTLLVLSTGLFGKPAFKNVIVNGIILSENGEKMSKRLKNYIDPMNIIDKYGVDALRYYLLSSPAVRAETLNFSEKTVEEIYKKIILRLLNVVTFYKIYNKQFKSKKLKVKNQHKNILDKWIVARLKLLQNEIYKAMENYELDKATRPIEEFIDDLSTWYIRRSRDRFKNEKQIKEASDTINFTLTEFSKIIAPFMPFIAEYIYKKFTSLKSVHLEKWPENKKLRITNYELKIIKEMQQIRKIVSLALEQRAKAGIKIRQPLQELRIKKYAENVYGKQKLIDKKELLELIKDEVNVKSIVYDKNIKNEVELDIKITTELEEQGLAREFVRFIQSLRKEARLMPDDIIEITVSAKNTSKRKQIEKWLIKYQKEIVNKIKAKKIYLSDKEQKSDKESEFNYKGEKIIVKLYKCY
ncbi:MAG: Isoleucine-tRNA ligase [Parcubacteria group bacterium GW2011_GWA2_31_28]|nr:MAG: Isoleucine-tRNA ligase [Parcubacteria group bacterium GW2011_GWA2_31_28]